MVRIAIRPHSSRECAQGIALILPVLLNQELLVLHNGLIELQSALAVNYVRVDNNLVEQVPAATVDIRPDSLVEFLPERVIEPPRLGLLYICLLYTSPSPRDS